MCNWRLCRLTHWLIYSIYFISSLMIICRLLSWERLCLGSERFWWVNWHKFSFWLSLLESWFTVWMFPLSWVWPAQFLSFVTFNISVLPMIKDIFVICSQWRSWTLFFGIVRLHSWAICWMSIADWTTFNTLSFWWECSMAMNRWRTIYLTLILYSIAIFCFWCWFY